MAATIACSPKGNEFSSYRQLPDDGWKYGDTIVFTPELADSVATGRLDLALLHSNEYTYSNLWLEMTIADSISSHRDTINIIMADRLGRWLGRGIGTDFQPSMTVADTITLSRDQRIIVRHIMRSDRLTDIERIGICFTPHKL